MKHFLVLFAAVALLALHACTTGTQGPPSISPAIAASGAQRGASVDELNLGRSLFVSRCIQCHALPEVGAHSADQWRKLVPEMAGRARLKPEERAAVLAYLVATRTTM